MAGDGATYTNGTRASSDTVKVHRLSNGSLFGACGSSGWCEKIRAWIDGGCDGEPAKGESADAFLLLKTDGSLWQGGEDGLSVLIEVPFAIGSGMDIAIGAMDAGASVERAIEIACDRDKASGGKITVLDLEQEGAAELAERLKAGA